MSEKKTRLQGGPGKPFPKGKSGNPSGRPKVPENIGELRALARSYTEEAIATLATVMATGGGPARVVAANALLDRGWGKAAQIITGDEDGGAVRHTVRVIFEDGRTLSQ